MLEWSWRVAPWGRPFYLFFRTVFSRAYRYLDARLHAPALNLDAAAYVGGDRDPGIPAAETRRLAGRVGGDTACQVRIVRHFLALYRSRGRGGPAGPEGPGPRLLPCGITREVARNDAGCRWRARGFQRIAGMEAVLFIGIQGAGRSRSGPDSVRRGTFL